MYECFHQKQKQVLCNLIKDFNTLWSFKIIIQIDVLWHIFSRTPNRTATYDDYDKKLSLSRLPTIRWNHFWRSILIFLPLLIKVFTNDFIQKYTYLENLKWKKLRKLLQKCFDSNIMCCHSRFFVLSLCSLSKSYITNKTIN